MHLEAPKELQGAGSSSEELRGWLGGLSTREGLARVPGEEGSEPTRTCSSFCSNSDSYLKFSELGGDLGGSGSRAGPAPASTSLPGQPEKGVLARGHGSPRHGLQRRGRAGHLQPKTPPAFPTRLFSAVQLCPPRCRTRPHGRAGAPADRGAGRAG